MADYELRAENPAAVRFTLTMTLSLAEWVKLRDSFGNVQPNYGVTTMKNAIYSMVRQAEDRFGYEPGADVDEKQPE